MKKIFLSPSNQTPNKYAYGSTNEADECGKMAEAAEKALKRCGFDVKTMQWESMQVRCKESDKWGADLHIPIHTNAYNGKVTGTRTMCYEKKGEGYKASQAIHNRLAPLTPGTSENVSAHPELYELNTPKAPAVYIEVDFHDVASIAKWLIENTEAIGEAICQGVCDYFGVKYVAPGSSTVETAPEKTDSVLYRVQVGAYSVKANAEAMLDKLKKAGFDGFITTSAGNGSNAVPAEPKPALKSVDEIAREVIQGKWGNGTDRKNRLTAAGYDFAAVQQRVNELLK